MTQSVEARLLPIALIVVAFLGSACRDGGAPSLSPDVSVRPTTATADPGRPSTGGSVSSSATSPSPVADGPAVSDGRPARATLTIPSIGVRALVVEPYEGWTDDAPGTDLQDRGLAAAPYGPRGGTGPGGVGNYQVTAHRNSSTAAFYDLPALGEGQRVRVDSDGRRYVYRITATRTTSFRSPRSLAEQRAAVPGRPGAEPTRAMITLSTCRTQEDHAEGNFWSDEFGNPEHRVDKVGVLVSSAPSPDGT